MKSIVKSTVLALVALFATAAFAGDATAKPTKLNLTLNEAVTINGTKLAPGDYKVFVTRTGDDANFVVKSGNKELVNTSAKYEPRTQFSGDLALAKTRTNDVVEFQSKKLQGMLVFKTASENMTEGAK